ncbi:uncharacterized protein LOC108096727 [Drosophila ficusphila]|uniref:uncharacterized protein LOC108096727 n=1 Tax=Drosophila ficusphila TaxID=30025 RepID=UPI0007E62C21|nr:uncharacterized protein LOC108096727 [Drosophila ficusphila]
MGRQSTCRLVLLLAISLAIVHANPTTTSSSKIHYIHDDLTANELDSGEDASPAESLPKISTPKVKDLPVETTTKKAEQKATEKSLSEDVLKDLMEAAKHSQALAEDPHFNKMINATVEKSPEKNSTDGEDNYDNDYYNYDEEDYSYFDEKTTTKSPKGEKNKPKLQPIVDSTKDKNSAQKSKESTNDIDSDSQYDYNEDDDDDDDEDDDASDEQLTDDEHVVFSEDVPCPRFCTCARNINAYMVATCSRLDVGIQKFGSDITDLVVTNVGPKYPILVGPNFFLNLGLKNVASIKIANCTLEYLHAEAFNGLDNLYALNLTDVGLALINPDTFANNKMLRMLTISGNDLSVMSSVRYLLKSNSIEELDLSRNNLMELNPKAFSKLTNVVYINLSQNSLKKLPETAFETVTLLEELDLSYNSLTELPRDIFNTTTLSILHLKYNTFNGDLHFGTKDLQQLDLSFNSIESVHHSMFDKMPGLTNLNLKGNGIKRIQPDSFLTLKLLRHIDLSINELDQISGMLFFKNSELDVIRLNDNPRLSQLPTDGFLSYSGEFTVYYLDISNCAIGPLGHKTFSTMPHLATLKLAWNNINHLPREIFSGLHKLIDLDLSNNLISRIDDLIFMDNGDLSKLSLAGNPISHLSVRLFLPLHQLRSLDVSNCELTALLSDTKMGLGYKIFDSLRNLNASENVIRKISSADVKGFKNLRLLDISNNPLKCTRDFQDFISYVTLQMQLSPKRTPMLANLEEDATLVELENQAQAGWASLAHEVCKHEEGADLLDEKKADSAEAKLEKRLKENEKKLDEDEEKLLSVLDKSVLDKSRLSSMQKIMKGSVNAETVKHEDDSAEENLNNGGEDKEEDSSDYDSEEDDDDDDDDNDDDDDDNDDDRFEEAKKNAKKSESDKAFNTFVNKELKPVLKDDGVKVEEVEMSKEPRDKFLLDKFGFDSDSEELDSEEYTEKVIYHGQLSYDLVVPVIIVSFCLLMIVLSIARVIYVVLRKRGERYRMALMKNSKNNFVYQKLSEEIVKPTSKDQKQPKHQKQPKVHRYAPINQV